MTSREQALVFAHEWIEAWNAHDLPRVLEHYTDDFEMSSPLMIQMGLSETGTLKGKQQIADYWQKGLAKYPKLHFKLIDVFSSVNSIIIYYRTINNKLSAELFMFNDAHKVYKSAGYYN
jgi:hypothetical protein